MPLNKIYEGGVYVSHTFEQVEPGAVLQGKADEFLLTIHGTYGVDKVPFTITGTFARFHDPDAQDLQADIDAYVAGLGRMWSKRTGDDDVAFIYDVRADVESTLES